MSKEDNFHFILCCLCLIKLRKSFFLKMYLLLILSTTKNEKSSVWLLYSGTKERNARLAKDILHHLCVIYFPCNTMYIGLFERSQETNKINYLCLYLYPPLDSHYFLCPCLACISLSEILFILRILTSCFSFKLSGYDHLSKSGHVLYKLLVYYHHRCQHHHHLDFGHSNCRAMV